MTDSDSGNAGGDLFTHRLTRRTAVTGLGSGLVLIALGQVPSRASDAETESVIRELFGDARPQIGRITLSVPSLAESGNSVPLTVSIDSPMTESDHVRRVCIFANRNPRPLIATMIFGPNAGRAAFSTNMRLSGTQDVIAMAQMSDGTLWTEQARVMVTIGACDSLQMRN
jgi:sulfur-oxidizing protein SoxY